MYNSYIFINSNSQYVPPELSINPQYHSELADIWVLGVFLYRMLIGKYPFSAENDQMLFKKMLHSNFTLPNELSDGNCFFKFINNSLFSNMSYHRCKRFIKTHVGTRHEPGLFGFNYLSSMVKSLSPFITRSLLFHK